MLPGGGRWAKLRHFRTVFVAGQTVSASKSPVLVYKSSDSLASFQVGQGLRSKMCISNGYAPVIFMRNKFKNVILGLFLSKPVQKQSINWSNQNKPQSSVWGGELITGRSMISFIWHHPASPPKSINNDMILLLFNCQGP